MTITARAHQILDRVRNSEPVSPALINWALQRTGDMPKLGFNDSTQVAYRHNSL